MTTLDLKLRIQWANWATGKLVNQNPKNLVGQYCFQVWHGRESPCEDCPVQRSIQTGEPQEADVASSDGRHWHVRSYPLRSQEGALEGVVKLTQEITERKQVEGALRDSEERYKKLFNTSPDAIALVDEQGRFLTANPAMAQRFGLSQEELEGRTYHDLMPRNLADKRIADAEKSLNNEDVVCIEDERQERHLQNYYVPLSTSDSQRTFQIISRDITEQKKAEEKFRNLFECANDAIFLMREDKFIECNVKTLEIFSCTRDQILGKPPYLFSPELQPDGRYSRDKSLEKINMCLQGEPQFFEWRHLRYNGSPFEAEVSLNQVWSGQETVIQAIVRDITQRKQMEKELRESKEFSSALMDNTPYPVVVKDSEGSIIYVNSALENLTGFTAAEVVGKKPPFPWWTQVDLQQIEKYFQRIFYEDWLRVEHWFQKKNGELFCVEITSSELLEEDGEVKYVLSNWVDITERKRAEEALRQSENHYRAIFETTGTAMFIIEKDTTISHVNTNFEELSGYSGQEVEGKKSWGEFIHPDDLVWMKEYHYLRRQNSDAAPRHYEFRFITRHGEERSLMLAIDIIPGTNRSIASGIDITERKQMEQALRESEKKYREESNYLENLLEHSADAIGILNRKGRIVRWNRRAVELTGYSFEEIQERHFSEFYAQQEDMESLLASLRINGSVRDWEVTLVNKDGLTIPCSVSVGILYDEKNEVIGSISIMRDLTEWKKAQQKLEELSIHDTLTGLYNRNFFEEEMNRLCDGRHNPLGIIVCDLDGLKFINDALGHQAGDQMLINAADILRRNFRSSEIMARIGGDEFAVLLTKTDKEVVEQIMRRLRQAVKDYNWAHPELPVSLSFGHAMSEGETSDLYALFREADNRMYREKIQQKESSRSFIVDTLTESMQARDFETESHVDRLQELATSLSRTLNLSQNFINDLYLLARFHDLGKVGISDHILFKPGPLTEEEWRQMSQHCEIGHRIASSVPDLEPIADYILKHHEWWDGRGYPWGLAGRDIPLACRILAIVDAYDAMTSDRPYRKAMTREEAIAELKRCAGTQFDPVLVEQFIGLLQNSDNY